MRENGVASYTGRKYVCKRSKETRDGPKEIDVKKLTELDSVLVHLMPFSKS